MSKIIKTKGFALLYAILLSGAVLSVGMILMNIITKQLLFSSLNRDSEVTYYYLANSGRECLESSIIEQLFAEYDPDSEKLVVLNGPINIGDCFDSGDDISLNKNGDIFEATANLEDGKAVELSVQVNATCLNSSMACSGDKLIDRYSYVAIATGYSGSAGQRQVQRSAVYVLK